MKYKYTVKSPCKINLSLEVHEKRKDGYHNLTSIFQMVSLEDIIFAEINNDGKIRIEGNCNCDIFDNLMYKAAYSFLKKSGIKNGINLKIDKKIPTGGGIGGGSSNCAAVLRLLNFIYPKKLSENDLFKIAINLGSDVPFFLGDGTALVQGRGELVSPLTTLSEYSILMVNPGVHISTAKAFSLLRNKNIITSKSNGILEELIKNYYDGIEKFSNFKNSFELALYSDFNFINSIKGTMIKNGALYSGLSGSGSTMFGVFPNEHKASIVKKIFSLNKMYKVFLVKPLDKFPEIIKTALL